MLQDVVYDGESYALTREHWVAREGWCRERGNLERRLTDARSAVAEVGSRCDEIQAGADQAMANLQREMEILRARLRGCESDLNQQLERAERAESSNDALRETLVRRTESLRTSECRVMDLESELEDADRNLTRWRDQYGSCECELVDARLGLSAAGERQEKLEKRLENQQRTIEKLFERVGGAELEDQEQFSQLVQDYAPEQVVLAQTDESEAMEIAAAAAMSMCSSSDDEFYDDDNEDDDEDRPNYRSQSPQMPENYTQWVDEAMAFRVEESSDEESDEEFNGAE